MNAVERVLLTAGVLAVFALVLAPVVWSLLVTFGEVRW